MLIFVRRRPTGAAPAPVVRRGADDECKSNPAYEAQKRQRAGFEDITGPLRVVIAEYQTIFPRIDDGSLEIVPWYAIEESPEAFGRLLLEVADDDPVCRALMVRATEVWGVDFTVARGVFRTPLVHNHFLKLLKNWLNPGSGNLGHTDPHRELKTQYRRVWEPLGLEEKRLSAIANCLFFRDLKVAGRRDRIQIYRNVHEAARALVGEVTSWPSRAIEKITALTLLQSPELAALQRRMIAAVVRTLGKGLEGNFRAWEYLPYYLFGTSAKNAPHDTPNPCVLGVVHDCLNDVSDTQKLHDPALLKAFQELMAGAPYKRWRKIPLVVRYQAIISDLARILVGKTDAHHQRIELENGKLRTLPALEGFRSWRVSIVDHDKATPHDPGGRFSFATTWTRNELCPNVVTSRLLLAPLYAGTSGHAQGRTLAWRKLAERCADLRGLPLGLVICTGYSVLWRLFYDKRGTPFHTMFEALQGTHIDPQETDVTRVSGSSSGNWAWSALCDCSQSGKTDVRRFWEACIVRIHPNGATFPQQLKAATAVARQRAMEACKGTVIPHWDATEDADRTGPDVEVWSVEENLAVLSGEDLPEDALKWLEAQNLGLSSREEKEFKAPPTPAPEPPKRHDLD